MTRNFFIPNRLGLALLILFSVCLLLTGTIALAAAQDDPLATNTPVTVATFTPAPLEEEPLPTELPDAGPVIDEATDDLDIFLLDAKVVIALAAWFLTQALKYLWRNDPLRREVSGQQIYVLVIGVLSALYFIGNLTGYLEQIRSGVKFLSVLADPLWQIVITLGGSSLIYLFGRGTGNVLMGGGYSSKANHLEKPEPINVIPGRVTSVELTAIDAPDFATTGDVQRMIDNAVRTITGTMRGLG